VPRAILLPSERERQQIFHWLERVSSYTAWRRIVDYYAAWAAATHASLRAAEALGHGDDTTLSQTEYALIAKDLTHLEDMLARMRQGDKTLFQFNRYGHGAMHSRMLNHWSVMLDRIRYGENGIRPQTPLWEPFTDALTALCEAWGECGPHVLETRDHTTGRTHYGAWLRAALVTMPFPDRLGPVLDPVANTFIETHDRVPCAGIWEPITVERAATTSWRSLFRRSPLPKAPFRIAGAMNYLREGAMAPRLTVETTDDSMGIDTTWRLLWQDERYQDGTIPEQEAQYRFAAPLPPPARRPVVSASGEYDWTASGFIAHASGIWMAAHDLTIQITIQKGETLPLHQGSSVRWLLAQA
jgi:hypothetical protein